MAVIQTGVLQLPNEVAGTIIKKVAEESVIARLAPATARPTILNDQYAALTVEPELDFVVEGGNKPASTMGVDVTPTQTFKAVGILRFSQEVLWADEDTQMGLLQTAFETLGSAGGRALDYGVLHAFSPNSRTALTGYTSLVSQAHAITEAATPDEVGDVDSLPDQTIGAGYEFNGVALAPAYANRLRKLRNANTGAKVFPELGLDLHADSTIDGVACAVSSTVNGSRITTPTKVLAVGGDWSKVRWGIVREIRNELIEYGDPDGLGDLKRKNEVALLYEILYKWAVIDPANAFSVIKSA